MAMILFSIAAVLLSALAAALILQRAAGAARRPDFDPTVALYRRQLNEIDDLAERGLLDEGELRTARAEASRRLLGAAQSSSTASGAAASAPSVSGRIRLAVLGAAVAAPLLAVGLYLFFGSPGAPDQPFAARLKTWSETDPRQLDAPRMAALLETVVKRRPTDVEPLVYLARAQAASGNLPAAVETLRKATRLSPGVGDLWADLGQLLVLQTQGQESAASTDAFRHAVVAQPANIPARYHLARAKVTSGDVAGGLADWRALLADVPPGDEQQALAQEIEATARAGHLVGPLPPEQTQAAASAQDGQIPAEGSQQRAFIQAMVARLAARLQQAPDDPAGWARLIRSYAILGDAPRMQATLDQAHKVFKDRPADLKTIDNAMAGPAQ
jgi:cytochrome c-type biogenesis protein CcmH